MLSAQRIQRAGDPGKPFVLVSKQRGALRVVAVDERARQLGIEPNLTLADARARVPQLIAIDADPAADMSLLEWLAESCHRYTPMVAVDAPDALILDITGCSHLFDEGEKALAADMLTRMSRAGLSACHAFAATPDAALALARYDCRDVQDLPISALKLPVETSMAMTRAGLRYINDLIERSSASLAVRFGVVVPTLLARLIGTEDRRITPRRALPAVAVEARFPEPVAYIDYVMDVIAALISKVETLLIERGAGGRRFCITLYRSDGYVARLDVETVRAVRDPEILMRLLRERIDGLIDPLDPGFGYDALHLEVPVLQHMQLAEAHFDNDNEFVIVSAEQVIDQLIVRLGSDNVRRSITFQSYIPERHATDTSIISSTNRIGSTSSSDATLSLRPSLLLDPPKLVDRVMALAPDGPPRRFLWRGTLRSIYYYSSSERISAEWWKSLKAGLGQRLFLTRDYFRIEDSEGRRYWLFRCGLFSETDTVNWYLHGIMP